MIKVALRSAAAIAFLLQPVIGIASAHAQDTQGAQNMSAVSPVLTSADAKDPWSFAQPEQARVSHVSLDLVLDFDKQEVTGTAKLDVIAKPGIDSVVLDNNGLKITRITDAAGKDLPYTINERVESMGEPLTVMLPYAASGKPVQIIITYSAANSDALQWLSPEQTAGGKQPFLFSQGQPTLNRTWIPTQDSPGIRQSWDARITAPDNLTVVMSGLSGGAPVPAGEGRHTFSFTMDKPVAPYLIAIAAGDITFRELGPRTGVWAEPAMIDKAAAETADTEAMVSAAEELYGPYRWGRYDMIVLPPSFPYGG
ncbi:MAG: aminopeptidase, partial [Sphingomonadaceae bacterium]